MKSFQVLFVEFSNCESEKNDSSSSTSTNEVKITIPPQETHESIVDNGQMNLSKQYKSDLSFINRTFSSSG